MDQKEKARIRAREWYQKHKKRAQKTMKDWRQKNALSIKIKKQKYNQKNKEINALKAKKYRQKNSKKVALQKRNWYLKNKQRVFDTVKKNADPIKVRARKILYQAVKSGKIKKKNCKVCKAKKVHAHHSDYSKPLKVEWLCTKHHYEKHQKLARVPSRRQKVG